MEKMQPIWESEPLIDRFNKCRRQLWMHGLMTDRENDLMVKRIQAKQAADIKATQS